MKAQQEAPAKDLMFVNNRLAECPTEATINQKLKLSIIEYIQIISSA